MKKGIYIIGILMLSIAFVGCEKCEKPVFNEDPFTNASGRSTQDEDAVFMSNRSDEDVEDGDDNGGGSVSGGITDPNKDPDYDGIVDPDKDEDFDKDQKGK